MAESVEKILLSLQLDVDQITANLQKVKLSSADLKKEQQSLQAQMKELEKTGQTGSATYSELSRALIENKTASGLLKVEQKNLENQLGLNARALKAEEGSYEQLLRVQQLAQIELKNMQGSIKVNADGTVALTEANKAAQERVAQLKSTIIEFDQTIKDGRTNVGNYKDSFISAFESTGLWSKEIKSARTIIEGFRGTITGIRDGLKDYVAGQRESVEVGAQSIKVESDKARSIVTGFGATQASTVATEENAAATAAATGTKVTSTAATNAMTTATNVSTVSTGLLTGAVRIFTAALISTGIGAIVVALGSLIAFLTQTQRGMDLVSKVTTAVGAAFSVIIDRVSAFGEGISKIFSGDFSGGADAISKSFKGIGAEISKETAEAYKLKDALLKLEDQEIAYTETVAKNELKVAELRLKAKDTNLPLKERTAALKEAIAVETEEAEQQIKFAKERARISQADLDRGESTREEIKKNAEVQAEVYKLETDLVNKKRTLQTQLNKLEGKDEDQQVKVVEDAAKERLKIQENLSAAKAKLITDARTREIAEEKSALQKELAEIKGNSEQAIELRTSLTELSRRKELEINTKYDRQILAAKNEQVNAEIALERRKLDLINEANSGEKDPTAQFNNNLIALTNSFNLEIRELDQQKTERLQLKKQELEDGKLTTEQYTDAVRVIEEKADYDKLLRFKQSARDIADLTEHSQSESIQRILEQKKRELEIENPQEQYETKLQILALEAQAEITAANQAVLTAEQREARIFAIEQKYAKDKKALNELVEAQKLAAVEGTLAIIASSTKKSTALYKAAATAQALISTYSAANKALDSAPPPYNYILMAAVIAQGLFNVGEIINAGAGYYEGGYTGDGNPKEVSHAFPTPYVKHKREYVIPDKLLSLPSVSNYVSSTLEPMRTGKYPASSSANRSFEVGGFVDIPSVIKGGLDARAIVNLTDSVARNVMASFPPIYTIVQDVSEAQGVSAKIIDRANI